MVLECFSLYFDLLSPLYPPAEQVSIWGSYGRDEARAPELPFENAWKRWCNRSVHFFRSKHIFRRQLPPAPTSSVSFDGYTGKECWALLAQSFQPFF